MKYKEKPKEIKAIEFTGDFDAVLKFASSDSKKFMSFGGGLFAFRPAKGAGLVFISNGDFIIKHNTIDPDRRFSILSPKMFHARYEAV